MTFAWAQMVIRMLVLGALLAAMPLLAQRAPSPASPATTTWSLPSSKFVTALCVDQQGNLWTGTEDEGIWCSPVDGGAPIQYMPKDGLGDEHCYALACDTQGRIWAGHQSHGVSVFNGQKWQNYEVIAGLSRPDSLNGPLGERIFDIAVCPTDGDVWMAGSLGLSRYQTATGQWQYITRMEGLPSDQIQSIAFDAKGTIYAGTQCDGLAISKAPYAKWQTIQGPDRLPLAPSGSGLPTNLINDVLVGRDGTIWVATTTGLAFSKDKGKTFRFVRGADWADKVKGLYLGTPQEAQAKQPQIKAVLDAGEDAWTLAEDYCTSLVEDATGAIWVGHRQKPYEVLDPRTGELLEQGKDKRFVGKMVKNVDSFIFAMAASVDGQVVLGGYGEGLRLAQPASGDVVSRPQMRTAATFPLPAAAPSPSESQILVARLKVGDHKLARGEVLYLGEDWATKGDWVGRYGRQFALLCAANSPLDHEIAFDGTYRVNGDLGPHHDGNNRLRLWVHWRRSDDPRVLYNPCLGYRRQAEWDDNGEAYPLTYEGPDVLIRVVVPAGVHRLSFYIFNKDGNVADNRYRDYTLEVGRISPASPSIPQMAARCRIRDFRGGEYKSFAVAGPEVFLVKIAKNASLNVIVSSVMLDRLAGPVLPTEEWCLPMMAGVMYSPPPLPEASSSAPTTLAAWLELYSNGYSSRRLVSRQPLGVQLYRSAQAQNAQTTILNNWRWNLRLWTAADRSEFAAVVRKGREAFATMNQLPVELPLGLEKE